MKSIKGITLPESIVAVAVVGVITAIALPGYQYFIGKSQASEAVSVISHEKTKLVGAMKLNRCTVSGVDESIKTKYGTLIVSGTYKAVKGESCATGCTMTYTFDNDVKTSLKGKVVKVGVLKSLHLHQDTATTLEPKYIPTTFTTSQIDLGANCTDLKGNIGSITGGSVTGVEVGDADPTPPPPPPPPPPPSTTTPPPPSTTTPPPSSGTGGTGSGNTTAPPPPPPPPPPPYDYNGDYWTGELFCFAYNSGRADFGECIIVSNDRTKQLAHVKVTRTNMSIWDVKNILRGEIPNLRSKRSCRYTPHCTTTIVNLSPNWNLSNYSFSYYPGGKSYPMYN